MDGGVTVEAGTPADVIDNPQEDRTREFFQGSLSYSRTRPGLVHSSPGLCRGCLARRVRLG